MLAGLIARAWGLTTDSSSIGGVEALAGDITDVGTMREGLSVCGRALKTLLGRRPCADRKHVR